jgi:hypothetical protein
VRIDSIRPFLQGRLVKPSAYRREISEEQQVTIFGRCDDMNREVAFSRLMSLAAQSRFQSMLIETQISGSTTINKEHKTGTKSVSWVRQPSQSNVNNSSNTYVVPSQHSNAGNVDINRSQHR